MGNQHGSHSKGGGVVIEETLESMQKEKQRDDHLKNLDFKRTKSIRKSIAKRLKKRKKSKDKTDAPASSGVSEIGESSANNAKNTSEVILTQPAATTNQPSCSVTLTTTSAAITINDSTSKKAPAKVFEREDKKSTQNTTSNSTTNTKHKTEKIIRDDSNRKPLVGEPQPFPSHVQVESYHRSIICLTYLLSNISRSS